MKRQVFLSMCAAILAALLVLTGCPSDSDDTAGESFDRDVDIVVVGAGLAGSAAALSAVEAFPDVKVVLIDKAAVAGGSLYAAAGGIAATAYNAKDEPGASMTSWKNSSYVSDSANPILAVDTGYPNYSKVLAVARNTKELFDVAMPNWGVTVSGNPGAAPGNYWDGTSTYTNGNKKTAGSMGAAKLNAAVQAAAHIEFIGSCEATEILVLNGVVSGVRTVKDGKPFSIKAKNTILATGGFSQNADYLKNYVDGTLVPNIAIMAEYNKSTAAAGVVGDGIRMAKEVGAAIYDKAVIHLQGLKYSDTLRAVGDQYLYAFAHELYGFGPQLLLRPQILVNNEGKRFIAENGTISYASGSVPGRALFEDAKPPYYVIFDSNNPNPTISDTVVDLTAALDAGAALNNGEVLKAGSLDVLADSMYGSGTAAKTAFLAEVDLYNSDYASGTDSRFSKAAAYNQNYTHPTTGVTTPVAVPGFSKPINQGPNFYAVKLYPESHISIGGPKSDYLGRVLNENDAIIPHLYAVGELSNREFYNVNYVGAASLALYPTWGRMAGLDAAKDAKNK